MTVHLALPVSWSAGRYRTVPRGSLEEVAQSVRVLLATRPGERLSIPSYGVADAAFIGLDENAIVDAVAAHEPRAAVTVDAGRVVDGRQTAGVVVELAGQVG